MLNRLILFVLFFLFSGCEAIKFPAVSKSDFRELPNKIKSVFVSNDEASVLKHDGSKSLEKVLQNNDATISTEDGFASSLLMAVNNDPSIQAAQDEMLVRRLGIDVLRTGKDFDVTSSFFGGVEDVTDNTKGLAIVLSAKRMVFDGGKLEAEIASSEAGIRSLQFSLLQIKNDKAAEFLVLWSNIERYQQLKENVDSRLEVLEPLIEKLEEVTKAGIGDVTQVSAAQRTVTNIRAKKIEVDEKYAQAKLAFESVFGEVPSAAQYDEKVISSKIPKVIDDKLIFRTPAIQAEYAAYQAAEASLTSKKANDSFVVAFQSRLSRPIGGSSYDSDEAIGLVATKDLFTGKKTGLELLQAEAEIKAKMARLRAVERDENRNLTSIVQKIDTMASAIELSQKNVEDTTEEIVYLRQQLIIGGSTLDKVLSAEARLYEAQSKEIDFKAEKQIAEGALLAKLGLLTVALGF